MCKTFFLFLKKSSKYVIYQGVPKRLYTSVHTYAPVYMHMYR